jgi:dihydroorotate dehydrogenase electron transfer subunit
MMAFFHGKAEVRENICLARDTYRIRIEAPSLARSIRPGQFIMLRLADRSDPLLGRPFALYDTVLDDGGVPVAVDVVYLVIGKATRLMAQLRAGEHLEVWGPLGNGFPAFANLEHIGLVAGGIGQTPFLALARQLLGGRGYGGDPPRRTAALVSFYYGVRAASYFAGLDDFRTTGAAVHLATDDGSSGFSGYVTELLMQQRMPNHLVGCGPEPMLRALAKVASQHQVPCHVSLETPMACGLGICFSCVAPVKTANGSDYRRVCVDGPIFDSATVDW